MWLLFFWVCRGAWHLTDYTREIEIGGAWETFKHTDQALAEWPSWLKCHPIHQKAVGLIHSWGAYGRQLIDVSHINVSLSFYFSLKKKKAINVSLGEE